MEHRSNFFYSIWSNAQAQAEALERSVTLKIEKGGTTAAASADMDRKIASV